MSGASVPRRRLASGVLVAVLCLAPAGTSRALADSVTGLNIDVEYNGVALGDIRLHVGTHNFQSTGRDGLGRAAPGTEKSGFRPPSGSVLNDAFDLAGVDHFNWLQVITEQPAAHEGPFGPTPHADPSSDPDNQTPRDLDPWYLNEVAPTNPPFDLPPGTASLLEFQDFPNAVPWNLHETFSADVYLVGILDDVARTYTTFASFSWTLERNTIEGVTRVRMVELEEIDLVPPTEFQDVVFNYEGRGWTYVPEPSSAVLVVALTVLLVHRRRSAA